jgi:N-acetyl-anhydromuramyl-L-alanine amidase AmpD
MPLRRVPIPSPNVGEHRTSTRLIIIHTAEGARTFQQLGSYFANPSVRVSSHVGIDDTPGVIGEYVPGDVISRAADGANPYSTQAELCAFASWSRDEWMAHPVMLLNTAAWIAEEAKHYDIPIVKSSTHGVCGHVDVSGPDGHWDPGPGFPWGVVLALANGSRIERWRFFAMARFRFRQRPMADYGRTSVHTRRRGRA